MNLTTIAGCAVWRAPLHKPDPALIAINGVAECESSVLVDAFAWDMTLRLDELAVCPRFGPQKNRED